MNIIRFKGIRFLIAGGFNTLMGLSLYPFVYWLLSSYRDHYVWMFGGCHITSILLSYLTNKCFVFQSAGWDMVEFLRFIGFHGFYGLLMLVLLPFLVETYDFHPVILSVTTALIMIPVSYLWYNRVTFLRQPTTRLSS